MLLSKVYSKLRMGKYLLGSKLEEKKQVHISDDLSTLYQQLYTPILLHICYNFTNFFRTLNT